MLVCGVRYSVCCAPLPVCVRGVACGVAPGARWMLRARSYVVWARSRGVAPRQESVRSHTPPLRGVTCVTKVPLALASTAFRICDPRSTFPHHRHDTRRGPPRTNSAPPRHERVSLLVTGCTFEMKPLLACASISLSISLSMSEVAPDKRWMLLLRGASADLLIHTGTGELAKLDGERYVLDFDGDLSYVRPQGHGGSPRWCREIMREIVYKVEDEGAEARFYAMRRDTGESSWLDNRAKEPVLSAAVPLLLEGGPRAFPIHVSRIQDPRRTWWSLPSIVDYVLGSEFDGRYICRHYSDYVRYLGSCGVSPSHLRRSYWSYLKNCAANGELANDMAATTFHQEYSVTTEGLVALLAAWQGFKGKVASGHDHCASARSMMKALATILFPLGDGVPVDVDDGERVRSYVVSDRRLEVRSAAQGHWDTLFKNLVSSFDSVADVVNWCADVTRRPSRHQGRVQHCDRLLRALVELFGAQGELLAAENRFSVEAQLEQPPLFRLNSNKARRVGVGYKLVVCQTAASSELKTPQLVLAARAVGRLGTLKRMSKKSRKKRNRLVLSPKLGVQFRRVRMTQYRIKSVAVCRNAKWIAVCLDGLRVGQMDWTIFACENLDSRDAFWLPPQAPRSRSSRMSLPR